MHIDVYSDTICPWCYIGKRRLAKALDNWGRGTATISWRAFQLNPEMPPAGMDRQSYLSLKFGGATRASQIYGVIADNGRREDIPFAFDRIQRTPNTVDSHRLTRFAARVGRQEAVVEALFRAYFLNGIDIGDRDSLAALATSCGLDGRSVATYLASDRDFEDVQAEDRRARRLGIDGVPCFIVNGKYALSGAQEPEAFAPIFELAASEESAATDYQTA